MVEIIKGYNDIRNDNGILKFSEGDVFMLPMKFNINVKDNNNETVAFNIPNDYTIKVNIKKNRRFIENILEFTYSNIENNTIGFELNEEDTKQLRAGCTYILQAALYDGNEKKVLTLINDLNIQVE